VAREKHFGHAAQICFVSQPTLSVAIRKVEVRHIPFTRPIPDRQIIMTSRKSYPRVRTIQKNP
jgi:hypothetical protein